MIDQQYAVTPIAIAHTPFQQKFGIPRQAGLVNIPAVIELLPPFNQLHAVAGLEEVSHIWLTFLFSEHLNHPVNNKVRPPRLGGNKKVGVFATRSSFRPNGIGQSVVKLLSIEPVDNKVFLHVEGIDVLDGTPILDIKPYLPYVDICLDAVNTLAPEAPNLHSLDVHWQVTALTELQQLKGSSANAIQAWITALIQLDPRPAYKTQQQKSHYAISVFQLNVQWRMLSETSADIFLITMIE